MSAKNIQHAASLLERILDIFIKDDSLEAKKEMKRYDTIRFDDVNKEIKKHEKVNTTVRERQA